MPRRSSLRRRSGVSALLAGLAAALGLGPAAIAQTQGLSAADAPADWARYAQSAAATIAGWLMEDGAAASRLRTYLQQTQGPSDQPAAPLALKVWIEPDGTVQKVDFTPFADEAANADLRAAVIGRSLSLAPPKTMLLPLRFSVQLQTPDETAPA